jgi:hypothetical protein
VRTGAVSLSSNDLCSKKTGIVKRLGEIKCSKSRKQGKQCLKLLSPFQFDIVHVLC